MSFPASVGEFRRVTLVRYDADELDVSAGYNWGSQATEIVATVYIYPAPSLISIGSPPDVVASARTTLCNGEFERRKKEIVASHPGAMLISEGDVPTPQPGPTIPGKIASYEYEDAFQGVRQRLHSELYVYCYVGGKWAFEYRFTSPKDFPARDAISNFMAGLTWTVPVSH